MYRVPNPYFLLSTEKTQKTYVDPPHTDQWGTAALPTNEKRSNEE